MRPRLLLLGVTLTLAACGTGDQAPPDPATRTATAPAPTVSATEEGPMTADPRAAAQQLAPEVERRVREVAPLLPAAADRADQEGWVHGAPAACTGSQGGSTAWVGRGQVLDVADPRTQVEDAAGRLPDTWRPVDVGATTARVFEDADGYLLTLAWGEDPGFVNVTVESPCQG